MIVECMQVVDQERFWESLGLEVSGWVLAWCRGTSGLWCWFRGLNGLRC